MTALFRTVLNMSITGSWVILAVLLARLLLKKAPKGISYALWAVAGFRLCCPVSFEAVFSLFRIPHIQTGSAVTHAPAPVVQTTAPATPPVAQPMVTPAAPAFSWIGLFTILWAVGLAGAAISATVNELAGPLFGKFLFMILAIILLIFGHGLNMILNILSVIVHGIRLNTLEFSSHLDMSWSGHKFKPFTE